MNLHIIYYLKKKMHHCKTLLIMPIYKVIAMPLIQFLLIHSKHYYYIIIVKVKMNNHKEN